MKREVRRLSAASTASTPACANLTGADVARNATVVTIDTGARR